MKYITPYRETKPFTPSLPGNTLSKSRQYTPFSTIIFLYRTIKTNYYPPTYLYIYITPHIQYVHMLGVPHTESRMKIALRQYPVLTELVLP